MFLPLFLGHLTASKKKGNVLLSLGKKIKFGGSRIGVESYGRSSGSRELKEWFLAPRDWQRVGSSLTRTQEKEKEGCDKKEAHIKKQATG